MDQYLEAFQKFAKLMVGSPIKATEAMENLRFVNEAKEKAKEHDWLFHCTHKSAFFNIIKNKEFWLSNLKLANDQDEPGRIDVPSFKTAYYIASFTSENNVSKSHWQKYASSTDGVLVGFKREWFKRNAVFLDCRNEKDDSELYKIYPNCQAAKLSQKSKGINPYVIFDFNFYQVVYDNKLEKNIQGKGLMIINNQENPGRTNTPEVAGIIKREDGINYRPGEAPYPTN